jgi:hypothetical protein
MRRPRNPRVTKLLSATGTVRIHRKSGPDSEVPGGMVRAEFFVARDVPADEVKVTEGSLSK